MHNPVAYSTGRLEVAPRGGKACGSRGDWSMLEGGSCARRAASSSAAAVTRASKAVYAAHTKWRTLSLAALLPACIHTATFPNNESTFL